MGYELSEASGSRSGPVWSGLCGSLSLPRPLSLGGCRFLSWIRLRSVVRRVQADLVHLKALYKRTSLLFSPRMRRLAGVGVLAVVGLITTCFVATWVSLGSSQQWWGNSTVSSSSDEQGREESRERLAGGPFADEWEHTSGVMVHTKEYQVKLRSFDWEDRKAQAKRFLHKMKELSEGMFPFSWSASQEDVREQYHLGKISNCGRKQIGRASGRERV